MPRIPTYESKQYQVEAEKKFHSDSAASVVASGVADGLQRGAQTLGAIDKHIDTVKKQAIEDNRNDFIIEEGNSTAKMNKEYENILKTSNSPEDAWKKIDDYTNTLNQEAPATLNRHTAEIWKTSNLKRAAQLKQNAAKSIENKKATAAAGIAGAEIQNRKNNAMKSGILGIEFNEAKGFDIGEDDSYNIRGNVVLPKEVQSIDDSMVYERFRGNGMRPLFATQFDDGSFSRGILGDADVFEGETERRGFWGRMVRSKENENRVAETKQQKGSRQIDEYFDKQSETIENNPQLSSTEKKRLQTYNETYREQRKTELSNVLNQMILNMQKEMGRTADLEAIAKYLDEIPETDENDLRLNANTNGQTQSEIRAADTLANLYFGNSEYGAAGLYQTAPMGGFSDFSAELRSAITNLNLPTGKWTSEDLYAKYAPNGTIQERQAVEVMARNNPHLEVTNPETSGDTFNELDWAQNTITEINQMPSDTFEQQQRKQAAINHALYQRDREINGGTGFKDKQAENYFNSVMTDTDSNQKAIIDSPEIINDMMILTEELKETGNNNTRGKVLSDISNVMQEYQKTGDKAKMVSGIRSINQDVLQARYQGVMDIADLQDKLEHGKPAIFNYNGAPYEYMGFMGKDIFIKDGKTRKTIRGL